MTSLKDIPERLEGYDWAPAYWATRRRERALKTPDLLLCPPSGIIIHSGATGSGTAQWAWREEALFWAHFAWDRQRKVYVQTDSLHSWAPHAGSLNRFAWGIETPHHPGAGEYHRDATVELVRRLGELGPRWLTGHRFVDAGKRDPGRIVTASWWDGLGLRVYWAWIGSEGLARAEGLNYGAP